MSAPAPLKPLDTLRQYPGRLILDWIGGIFPNLGDPSNPLVECVYTPLERDEDKARQGQYPYRRNLAGQFRIGVGVGYLPTLFTGQVLEKGQRLPPEAWWPSEELSITIDPVTAAPEELTLPALTPPLQHRPVITRYAETLSAGFKRLQGQVTFTSNRASPQAGASPTAPRPMSILIPEIELIRFYYASSTHMAKVLFQGKLNRPDWRHVLANSGDPPVLDPTTGHARFVYRHAFSRQDVPTLTRLLFDTSWLPLRGAQRITKSMSASHLSQPTRALAGYPRTYFPFAGPTSLQLIGYRRPLLVADDAPQQFIFIVHRILSCSAPFPVKELRCHNETQRGGTPAGPDAPVAFAGRPETAVPLSDDPFSFGVSTSQEPPHARLGTIETLQSTRHLPGFDAINVHYTKEGENSHRGAPGGEGRLYSSVSTGDPTHGASGSAALRIKDDTTDSPRSLNGFRGFLAVLESLIQHYPEWHMRTVDVGQGREDPESGIVLSLFPCIRNERRQNSYMQFSFLDREKTFRRQLIGVECQIAGRHVYLLEAESRPVPEGDCHVSLEGLPYALVQARDGRPLSRADYRHLLALTVTYKTWPPAKDFYPLILEKRHHSEATQTAEQVAQRLGALLEAFSAR